MTSPLLSGVRRSLRLGLDMVGRARRPVHWLRAVQAALIAAIALSLPAGVVAAFACGADRHATGDSVAVLFFAGFVALLSTPWWPTAAQGPRTTAQRLESTCLLWFGLTFATHLTWELGWLLLRERIIASPDRAWAFIWWMYIDGGDHRYATGSPLLITVERLSVCNGVLGVSALWLRWRSSGASVTAVLMLMATGVVHVYSTVLYFSTEALGGYPNVDTTSFVDFWIKFWLLNGLWVVMPGVVWYWGHRTLLRRLRPS